MKNLKRLAISFALGALCTISRGAESTSEAAEYDPPTPGTYRLPVIKAAADGALVDSEGTTVNLRELLRGRVTVLSFIYTRCTAAEACPAATGVLNQLHEISASDPELAGGLRLVSMSFDPEYDTPARLAAYAQMASVRRKAAEWRFLTAPTTEALQPILEAYDQAVDRKVNPSDPRGPLNHSLRVYLVDRDGKIRNIYSTGTLDQRLILADVRTLLLEGRGSAK
jgi:cytochrome oxidase Cu insertion factor (SCO1/SenC/PrrC family)